MTNKKNEKPKASYRKRIVCPLIMVQEGNVGELQNVSQIELRKVSSTDDMDGGDFCSLGGAYFYVIPLLYIVCQL